MFVRELQSKIIINKPRSNGNGNGGIGYETAEFRISLPIEELNLGLSDDNISGGNGVSKIEDYRNNRRIKRSYIVNIDLRELENKPGYNNNNNNSQHNHHNKHHSYNNNNSNNKKHYYSDRGYNNYKN
ncbi:unnamed protein product [[Candida] boidinii]|nr:unnamed protein product [[Candida] boidinii]